MNNNFIVLLVGASGSGKTTLANGLNRLFGWKPVSSYTTREKRHENESGHMFVSDKEFDQILLKEGAVAYTEYVGHRYCATPKQVEEAQVYVIDIPGVEYFKSHYKGSKKVITILLNLPESVRKERLLARGDSDKENARLDADRIEFSKERIAAIRPDLVIEHDYSKEELVAFVHWFVIDTMDKVADRGTPEKSVPKKDISASKTEEVTSDANEQDDDTFEILSKMSPESLKECIIAELYPVDQAEGIYDHVANLALVYRLDLSDAGRHEVIKLTPAVLSLLSSVSPAFASELFSLYQDGKLRKLAFDNMKRRGRITFRSVASMISAMFPLPEDFVARSRATSLHVLYAGNGAINAPSLILDKDILSVIRQNKLFSEDFYILPSSIHELLLIPDDGQDADVLTAMVRDINRDFVSSEEQLSNRIYRIVNGELEVVWS